MKTITIGSKIIGDNQPTFFIGEVGINHNGDIKLAKKIIDSASFAGCDAVKFQKRTIEEVYTPQELAQPRETPFGKTNGDLKRALEFDYHEYCEIDRYCRDKDMIWFASPWDRNSVDFLEQFDPPCHKISSACLCNDDLLTYIASKGKPIILSTGMSTMEQITHAVEVLAGAELLLMHCTSSYPTPSSELNLKVIQTLKDTFDVPVGYSGHEAGVQSSLVAVAVGACAVERHITTNRTMWGSDQATSLEPYGLYRLVRDAHLIPVWLGDGKKVVYESELAPMAKLRRNQEQSACLAAT